MKKGLLLVVVMLATIAVKAQDIYVGGSERIDFLFLPPV